MYLDLQVKIKLHFFALYCTGLNFKYQGDLSLMWLKSFKENKTEIAVVMDEFGGMSGIISLEDVLEEILGDVQDEFDDEEVQDIKKVGENKYIVNGLYRIDEFFEFFGINQKEEEIDTVGGLVPKILGRLAKPNDEIEFEGLKMRVIKMDDLRIEKILVIQTEKVEEQKI